MRVCLDQPQNGVGKRFAVAAHGAQLVGHGMVEPDQALAALVGLVLEADAAEREVGRNGVEGAWLMAMRIMPERA
jgi:hypothetical protein